MTDLSAISNHSQTHISNPAHAHHPLGSDAPGQAASRPRLLLTNSVLGWSAWQRVLAVLPVVLLLWLAVWWAGAEVKPW